MSKQVGHTRSGAVLSIIVNRSLAVRPVLTVEKHRQTDDGVRLATEGKIKRSGLAAL